MEKVSEFAQEQIPPRNVHGPGLGAFGTFTATNANAAQYSKAKLFESGKTTPFVMRFSGVFAEKGESDLNRDARGIAFKFKTEEGNWDLLAVNTSVFNCRDMKIGPDFIRSLKRDPRSGQKNRNMAFDFAGHHPESLHATLQLYTDRVGTPKSLRTQHWWACNTYSLINAANKRVWCRFHMVALQGAPEGFDSVTAKTIAGEEPGYLQRDIRDAIDAGKFPRWRLCVQVMDEEQGYTNPLGFDCTKVWHHDDFPLIELGIIEVNQNCIDHFTQTEQAAYNPCHTVPGIGFSPDKLLQGRLLMYETTQRHRVGPNHKMLPVNCPVTGINSNYYNGGHMNLNTRDKYPNYYPSVFAGNMPQADASLVEPSFKCDGPANFYDLPGEGSDADYYQQPRDFLKVQSQNDYLNLADNFGTDLAKCFKEVVDLMMGHFQKIDPAFAAAVQAAIAKHSAPATPSEKVFAQEYAVVQAAGPNGK